MWQLNTEVQEKVLESFLALLCQIPCAPSGALESSKQEIEYDPNDESFPVTPKLILQK